MDHSLLRGDFFVGVTRKLYAEKSTKKKKRRDQVTKVV